MKNKDQEEVAYAVENEGFDYAFAHYSDFPQIKDSKFHELRNKYLEARKALGDYLNLEDY